MCVKIANVRQISLLIYFFCYLRIIHKCGRLFASILNRLLVGIDEVDYRSVDEFFIIECKDWISASYLIGNSAKAVVLIDVSIELTASTIIDLIRGSIDNKLEGKTSWKLKASKQKIAYWKEKELVSQ